LGSSPDASKREKGGKKSGEEQSKKKHGKNLERFLGGTPSFSEKGSGGEEK